MKPITNTHINTFKLFETNMSITNNYKNFYQFIRKMSSDLKKNYVSSSPTQKMLAKRVAKKISELNVLHS